jgi:hypothetical protein
MAADYSRIPESALIALAQLILKRAKLGSLPCTNREQAIAIIRGVRPAPPRTVKQYFKPYVALCSVCHEPLEVGSLCDSLGRTHIACQEVTP